MITIEDLNLKGKKVLISVDYNVPLKDGTVADDERIVATFPLLDYCFQHDAKQVILISHLGRPQEEIEERLKKEYGENPTQEQKDHVANKVKLELNMNPVETRLRELVNNPQATKDFPHLSGKEVEKLEDCVGVAIPPDVPIVLLENLRFHKEEEKDDQNQNFAEEFVPYAEVMVQEAFGRCHRNHSSTSSIVKAYQEDGRKVAAGPLVVTEIRELEKLLTAPKKGFVAVLGGKKVSDKIGVIESLLDYVETLVIGGAMAYTFLKYRQNAKVGQSLVEDEIEVTKEKKEPAKDVVDRIYKLTAEKGVKIYLPQDHIPAKSAKEGPAYKATKGINIPDDLTGVDIGPETVKQYTRIIGQANTILWNGPMGVFEVNEFGAGTEAIARAVVARNVHTVIGGGDSVASLAKYRENNVRLKDILSQRENAHVSTGGGASLEFIEKAGRIPGLVNIGYQGVKK